MKRSMLGFVVCVMLGQSQSFADRLSDHVWGGYVGAYNCQVKGDQTAAGCSSLHVWYICYGYNGRTVFWNTPVALTVAADSPAEKGKWRGTLYINDDVPVVEPPGLDYVQLCTWRHMQREKAEAKIPRPGPKLEIRSVNPRQHAAIEAIFRRELAPYFGKDGLTVKSDKVNLSLVIDKGTTVYLPSVGPIDKPIAAANIAPDHKVWFMSRITSQAPVILPSFNSVKRIQSAEEIFKLEEGMIPLGHVGKFKIPPSGEPYPAMPSDLLVGMVAPDWQQVPIDKASWHEEQYRTFGKSGGTSFLGLFEFRGTVNLDRGALK